MGKQTLAMVVVPQEGGLIYSPSKRNMALRERIEDHMTIYDSRKQETVLAEQPIRLKSSAGAVFAGLMLVLFVATYRIFFG